MPEQTDVGALIAQLEAERDELNVTIGILRRRANLPAGETGSVTAMESGTTAGRDTPVVTGRVRSDEFFRMSIRESIMKFLAIMKQPQPPAAIVAGLKAGGVLSNAKHFYANVFTELKRMRDRELVVNTPSGWGLSEWYPQKPRTPEPTRGKRKKKPAKKAKEGPKLLPSGGSSSAGTWKEFMAAGTKAGKTLTELSAEWKAKKGAAG